MHKLKTGALLQSSVMMGAACGRPTVSAQRALNDYGATLGLAFQVVDDVLDVVADSGTLGKTAGKDAAQDKPTFVSLMGLQASKKYAQELLSQAHSSLRAADLENTAALRALADMLVNRGF
jgi:farnesyl diphosphate synthase